MILDKLFQYSREFVRYRSVIKIGLALAPVFVLRIRRSSPDILSNEPTHSYDGGNVKIVSPDNRESLFADNRFVLNGLPPRSTLRILGRPEQRECFYPLVSTLRKMEMENMNVEIDLGPRSRACMYLLEVDLHFDDEACVRVHPLRSHQPNSELLLVAEEFFKPKIHVDVADMLSTNTPSNCLEISLRPSYEDLRIFVRFLRAVSFIRAHPYGTYFYIPLEDSYVEIIHFVPAISLILAYHVFDWFCTHHPVSPARVVLGTFLYLLCPLSVLLFLRRNEAQCFIPIFMALNNKVGLAYVAVCYLRMLHEAAGIAVSILRHHHWSLMPLKRRQE